MEFDYELSDNCELISSLGIMGIRLGELSDIPSEEKTELMIKRFQELNESEYGRNVLAMVAAIEKATKQLILNEIDNCGYVLFAFNNDGQLYEVRYNYYNNNNWIRKVFPIEGTE